MAGHFRYDLLKDICLIHLFDRKYSLRLRDKYIVMESIYFVLNVEPP